MAYYGARTEEVAAIITRLRKLTQQEAEALDSAYDATLRGDRYAVEYQVTEAVLDSPHEDYWKAARDDALHAIPRAAHESAWFGARELALSAILAIFARDLIAPKWYDLLYGPWATLMAEGKGGQQWTP